MHIEDPLKMVSTPSACLFRGSRRALLEMVLCQDPDHTWHRVTVAPRNARAQRATYPVTRLRRPIHSICPVLWSSRGRGWPIVSMLLKLASAHQSWHRRYQRRKNWAVITENSREGPAILHYWQGASCAGILAFRVAAIATA